MAVFAVAIRLDPYRGGKVWLEGTHRQLNLPECTFKSLTGKPCPTCGMTSSFALLVRGDLANSLQANAAGTVMALFLLAFAPWCLASAWKGRLLFVRSLEGATLRLMGTLLLLAFVRWGLVLVSDWGG